MNPRPHAWAAGSSQHTCAGMPNALDLGGLSALAVAVANHRDDILKRWRSLYDRHFGSEPTLSADRIAELFARDLDSMCFAIRDGDMGRFTTAAREVGAAFLGHGVPFARAVGAAGLLSDALLSTLYGSLEERPIGALQMLGHFRLLEFASEYFCCGSSPTPADASATERAAVELANGSGRFGIVGTSPAIVELLREIEAAAQGLGTVFIVGESGTGKELTARAVHQSSGRSDRPLVVVNCAALPAALFESELFGHAEGAYTGAQRSYSGLIRAADGGTLFLDEITEMPATVQAKLLRVLEEGAVRPVGTTREIPARVRFIASTNRDPEQAVRAGLLRADVYHRVHVHRIQTPPLREHLDDIPELAYYFAGELAERGFRRVRRFHADTLALLQQYSWPGNVRELRNVVEVALTSGAGDLVRPRDLPSYLLRARITRDGLPATTAVPTLAEAERALIKRALAATSGNKRRAAQLLGISRHRLYDKIRKYEIDATPMSLRAGKPGD